MQVSLVYRRDHARRQPARFAVVDAVEHMLPVAFNAAHIGMGFFEAIEAKRHAFEPDSLGGDGRAVVPGSSVGDHVGLNPAVHQGGGDQGPILAQQGFAAPKREVPALQVGQVVGQGQGFRRGEFVVAALARARAAMPAVEVALEGQLPDAEPGEISELLKEFDHGKRSREGSRKLGCNLRVALPPLPS